MNLRKIPEEFDKYIYTTVCVYILACLKFGVEALFGIIMMPSKIYDSG